MLVLSRKICESIVIDNSIVITVLELNRGRIRLGIEAPPAVSIQRRELLNVRPPSAAKVALPTASPIEV